MQSPGLTLSVILWATLAAMPAAAAKPASAPAAAAPPASAAAATPPAHESPAAAVANPANPAAAARADSQLPDPTRPPASMLAPATATEEAALSGGLQSILLPKPGSGGKPRAVIHGQAVELGGRVGEARLVHLTETTAVLQGPEGREVLHLVPQDMVRLVRQPVGKTRAPQRKSRAAAPAAAPAP